MRQGRVVQARLQNVTAPGVVNVLAAYMPTRDKPERTVRPAWEHLQTAVANVTAQEHEPTLVMGDLNAELASTLAEYSLNGLPRSA